MDSKQKNHNKSLYLLLTAFLAIVLLTILVIKVRPATLPPDFNNSTKAELLKEINTLVEEQKISEAKKLILMELKETPHNEQLLSILAKIYFNQNELMLAEEVFIKLTEINPDDASIYNNLGLTEAKLGDFKNAEINYKKSLELNPKAPLTHLNLSRLYELMQDELQSKYHFNIARQLLEKSSSSTSKEIRNEQN